jgi:lysophospholipase L1-like esterase
MSVYLLGDSTLDNLYWLLDESGSNLEQAKSDSIEGHLGQKVGGTYQVTNYAYDGFTTTEVLEGGQIGRVLAYSGSKIKNYKAARGSGEVRPLEQLKQAVSNGDHVVISVGGNDFREQLYLNPIGMILSVSKVRERYLRIVDEVRKIQDRDVRPILMLLYRFDFQSDVYGIYRILGWAGKIAMIVQTVCIAAIVNSARLFFISKVGIFSGLVIPLISILGLALASKVVSLPVMKKWIWNKQNLSMAILGGLMEKFYRPILEYAKEHRIPVLDLPNTFDPYNSKLYVSQIEPSAQGGQLIAEGIAHIVQKHDYSKNGSRIYSGTIRGYHSRSNTHPSSWCVN